MPSFFQKFDLVREWKDLCQQWTYQNLQLKVKVLSNNWRIRSLTTTIDYLNENLNVKIGLVLKYFWVCHHIVHFEQSDHIYFLTECQKRNSLLLTEKVREVYSPQKLILEIDVLKIYHLQTLQKSEVFCSSFVKTQHHGNIESMTTRVNWILCFLFV